MAPFNFQEGGERHVGFAPEVEDEDEEHIEKTDLKLQRRDTPHYLKNKRVDLKAEPDEATAALLSQVLAKTKQTHSKDNVRIDRVRSPSSKITTNYRQYSLRQYLPHNILILF